MSFTVKRISLEREIKSGRAPRLWYTVTFCGEINGDGVPLQDSQRVATGGA
jgi:hypothetical protein